MGTILAIDPGNIESGYVLVKHDGQEIRKVLDVGKVPNGEIFPVLCREYQHLAIEMVAGMGMPVGQEVFDTCFWIGRFWEYAELYRKGYQIQTIFRREEHHGDNGRQIGVARVVEPFDEVTEEGRPRHLAQNGVLLCFGRFSVRRCRLYRFVGARCHSNHPTPSPLL